MFPVMNNSVRKTLAVPMLALLWILLIAFLAACQPTSPPQVAPPVTPPAPAVPAVVPANPAQAAGPVGAIEWDADGVISADEYQQSKTYGDFNISWSSDAEYVYIGMSAKTAGWVAIGFGAETLMKNADIIEGAVTGGKLTVADMFSTGEFGPHPPDLQSGGTDDILASAGKAENGYTTIEFKRKLDTGDRFDKPLGKGINKIIWAYSNEPVLTIKHSSRGTGEIELK